MRQDNHNATMNYPSQPNSTGRTTLAIFSGILLVLATALSARAQGQLPSGTISSSGTGPYTYNLAFSDSGVAASPIGSVWYAWVPGQFYLPGTPTGASAPSGW